MNHVEKMKTLIENGLTEFTHRDIILKTNSNCPYSTLRQLKKYYEIEYTEEKSKTKYRKFTIKGRKKCQKI